MTPAQYRPERILQPDVQDLLRRVTVSPNAAYSERFPNEMPCRIGIRLRDGRMFTKEMRDYPGFFTQPMTWDMAFAKFDRLAEPYSNAVERREIADESRNGNYASLRPYAVAGWRPTASWMRKEFRWLTGHSHS